MSIIFNKEVISRPSYQITELQEMVQRYKAQGRDIINATIGDPKDDTPPEIPAKCKEFFEKNSFSQYPPAIGSEELRVEISQWLNRHHQIQIDPHSQVVSCNGTKEAIFSLPLLFDWSQGNHVLIPSLSYPVYKMSAAYLGIPYEILPLNRDNDFLPALHQISTDALDKTQLFWINSPHNPTTTIASKDYLTKLVALAEKHNFIVCSDECYNDLYLENQPASVLDINSENWICFRSLSKRSHMTGYRSGAIISKNKTVISNLKKLRSPMGVGTPSFVQSSAAWAWSDDHHVEHHRSHYNQKRKKVKTALINAGLDVFGGNAGFYMWVRSNHHHSSQALSEWFLERNILVTPGTVFGDDGDPYVRLVFCLKDDQIEAFCKNISRESLQK